MQSNKDLNSGSIQGGIQDRTRRNSWGGARPGSGPKPKLLKQLREDLLASGDDAAYAYKLLGQMARDESLAPEIRLKAAKEILDRCWGKATAKMEVSNPEPPQVDPDMQARLLFDPAACELACDLDALLATNYPKV